MRVTIKEYFADSDEACHFEGHLLFEGEFATISFDVDHVSYTYKGERVREKQWLLKCSTNEGKAVADHATINQIFTPQYSPTAVAQQ